MVEVLLIFFIITLLYISISNRIVSFIHMLVIQGFILFGVTYLELGSKSIEAWNVALIMLETIVVKAVAVPYFLRYLIKKNRMTRETEPFLPNFYSLLIVTGIIVVTILLSNALEDSNLRKIFFVVALATLLTGLYFIASRKKVITHLIGYLIIENGVFVLSLAVGNEMPMLLNMGVILDVFAGVLLMGIFINKIGDIFEHSDIDEIKGLTD